MKTNVCAANPKKAARTLSGTKNGSTPTTVTAVHKPILVYLDLNQRNLFIRIKKTGKEIKSAFNKVMLVFCCFDQETLKKPHPL